MHVVSMLLGLLRLWPSQALRLCTGGLPDSQLAGLKGYFPRLRERLPPERRYIVPEVVDDSVYFETNYEPRYATSLGCCNGGGDHCAADGAVLQVGGDLQLAGGGSQALYQQALECR